MVLAVLLPHPAHWSILLLATCCGKQPAALAAMLAVMLEVVA